jgi:hypothetical protein
MDNQAMYQITVMTQPSTILAGITPTPEPITGA